MMTASAGFVSGPRLRDDPALLKANRKAKKAQAKKEREERQEHRRFLREFRALARQSGIELADEELRILSFLGKCDLRSRMQGKQLLDGMLRAYRQTGILSGCSKPLNADLKPHSRPDAESPKKTGNASEEKLSAASALMQDSPPASKEEPPSLSMCGGTLGSESESPMLLHESAEFSSLCAADAVPEALQSAAAALPCQDKPAASAQEENVHEVRSQNTEDALWEEIEMLENSVKYWQNACETAEAALHKAEEARRRAEAAAFCKKVDAEWGAEAGKRLAQLVVNANRRIALSDALEIAEGVLPDRLTVLPSAYESARKLDGVSKRGNRLLTLLLKLGTEYFDVLVEKGDAEARKIFTPSEYAACESDTAAGGHLGRRREFVINGEAVRMEQHLKIGVSSDTSLTLRCYFVWKADARRFVIGYCGEHLPVALHK